MDRQQRPVEKGAMRRGSAAAAVMIAAVLASGCGSSRNWLGETPKTPDLKPETSPAFGTLVEEGGDIKWGDRIVLTAARPKTGDGSDGLSSGDGNDEIFTVDPSGQTLLRHTNTTAADREPTWNPDHSRMVVVRSRQRGLPDGTFFQSEENAERTDLYVLTATGKSIEMPAKLVPGQYEPDAEKDEKRPRTLEDTAKLALWRAQEFVDGDRKGVRVAYPRYSPDGRSLAVMVIMDDGSARLFVADAEGVGKPRKLAGFGGPAAWRPDGKQIVFSAFNPANGRTRLYVIAAAGGDPKALTDPPAITQADRDVVFIPTGTNTSDQETFPRYFVDTFPVFAPSGAAVVFSRTAPIKIQGNREGGSVFSRLPRLLRLAVAPPANDPAGLIEPAKDAEGNPVPLEVLTQETRDTPREETCEDAAAAFSPAGDQLIFTRRTHSSSNAGWLYILNLNTDLNTQARPPQPLNLAIDGQTLIVGAAAWR